MSYEVTLNKINASVLSNGAICPVCEHRDENEDFEYNSDGLVDSIECGICGSSWNTYMAHTAISYIRLPDGSQAILPEGQLFLRRRNTKGYSDKTVNYIEATANIRLILNYFKNPSSLSARTVAHAVARLNVIIPDVE